MDIQPQALNLPIQQETQTSAQNAPQIVEDSTLNNLHSWTKSLIGVLENDEDFQEQYMNDLEEKYR